MWWTPKVLELSDGDATISPVGVVVWGVYVNITMQATICHIRNGATEVFAIPASTSAGTSICFAGGDGVLFDTNLTIEPHGASAGNITVMYRNQK